MKIDDLAHLLKTASLFQLSRALLTAVELNLFTHVGDGATAEEIAQRMGAHVLATEMLLNVMASVGLVHKKGEVYSCSDLSKNFLTDSSSMPLRKAILHTADLWKSWSHLTERVINGHAERKEKTREKEKVEAFLSAMYTLGSMRAPTLWDAVNPPEGVLLDVGGGPGAYAIEFVRRNPSNRAVIFDLPSTIQIAEKYVASAGVRGRVTFQKGDFFKDDFEGEFDVLLVSSVIHIFGPEKNKALLKKCAGVTKSGGIIVIHDFILDETKTEPLPATLFALNMLVNTEEGRTYTASEIYSFLEHAGFKNCRKIPLPGPTDVVVGEKA